MADYERRATANSNKKNKVRPGGDYCSAINCTNGRYKCPGLSLFRFPKEEARCKIWVQQCRRRDLQNKDLAHVHKAGYFLCSKHFEDSQFMNAALKNRLVWNAVPSLFDVPNPPPCVTLKRTLPAMIVVTPDSSTKKRRSSSCDADQMASSDQSVISDVKIEVDIAEEPELPLGSQHHRSNADQMASSDQPLKSDVKIEVDIAEEPELPLGSQHHRSKENVKTTLAQLPSNYMRQLRNERDSKRSGAGREDLKQSKWPYFEALTETVSNLQSNSQEVDDPQEGASGWSKRTDEDVQELTVVIDSPSRTSTLSPISNISSPSRVSFREPGFKRETESALEASLAQYLADKQKSNQEKKEKKDDFLDLWGKNLVASLRQIKDDKLRMEAKLQIDSVLLTYCQEDLRKSY